MAGGIWVIRPPIVYRCPVCWVEVDETDHGNIMGHFDGVGRHCEASHEPFRIANAHKARP